MRILRFDTTKELGKPVMMDNGWMRVDAFISRTGIQVYYRDGKEVREYRPPAEVFKADTLASFRSVPVTNDHPPAGRLDVHNTATYQVGSVHGEPHRDGTRTRASLLLTDAKAIEALKAGKTQISCGYMCDLVLEPGTTPEGEHYDAMQTNISGNHVALVDEARGGPELCARVDSAGALIFDERGNRPVLSTPSVDSTRKALMDPEQIKKMMEAAAAEKAALQVKLDAAEKRAETAEKALSAQTARADMAEAKVAKAEKEAAEAPAKVRAQVEARNALESKARAFLPEAKFDGKTDAQVKAMVIEANSSVKVDGKDAAYVDAAFDLVTSSPAREGTTTVVDTDDAPEESGLEAAQRALRARLEKFNSPTQA